jgi:hypothetical protein
MRLTTPSADASETNRISFIWEKHCPLYARLYSSNPKSTVNYKFPTEPLQPLSHYTVCLFYVMPPDPNFPSY